MQAFSALLDRLILTPQRNGKLRLIEAYLGETEDPERGWALAALTDSLDFRHAKPGLIRQLVEERTDPVLFRLSYDYVGDLSETVSLIWPAPHGVNRPPPDLVEIVDTLDTAGKAELPAILANWLDSLDETGRWALLKLITGGLRIGVSARLAKTALAGLGGRQVDEIEEIWHGLAPPYEALFAWLEGRGPRPENDDPAPFRPAMLAHPMEEADRAGLDAGDVAAEWKWDGIRVQAVAGRDAEGRLVRRLYSRTGDDISPSFPDLLEAMTFDAAIDGELLVLADGRVQPFNSLQQRLNRKTVSPKLLRRFPAHIRCYDLLTHDGTDLRPLPFRERREALETFVAGLDSDRFDLSPLVTFDSWETLAAARADPKAHGAGEDADAVEGLMLKRWDSTYVAGRPKGPWFKWKRDPFIIDAVLLYAQRGHGKRSSFYSDYTFGVWRTGAEGDELVPVGKAYFGFTDEELKEIDRYVRRNTTDRFGPVRQVRAEPDHGLVVEVAFEGLNRSTRHKSGVAMRFPRISRLRWDKPPREADRIDALEALLPQDG